MPQTQEPKAVDLSAAQAGDTLYFFDPNHPTEIRKGTFQAVDGEFVLCKGNIYALVGDVDNGDWRHTTAMLTNSDRCTMRSSFEDALWDKQQAA